MLKSEDFQLTDFSKTTSFKVRTPCTIAFPFSVVASVNIFVSTKSFVQLAHARFNPAHETLVSF